MVTDQHYVLIASVLVCLFFHPLCPLAHALLFSSPPVFFLPLVGWLDEYNAAKVLSVRVVSGCGRGDLALSLADEHEYFDGAIALCHEAELHEVGGPNAEREGGRERRSVS